MDEAAAPLLEYFKTAVACASSQVLTDRRHRDARRLTRGCPFRSVNLIPITFGIGLCKLYLVRFTAFMRTVACHCRDQCQICSGY